MTIHNPSLIHADAVITGDADVIRDGAVAVNADGVIEDVGPAADVLPRHAGAPVTRVRGVVFPGLVNAHTHLELSALRGQVAGGAGFVPWVERLIGVRAEAEPEADEAAVRAAVDELVAVGTSAVGEVTNSLAAVRGLARRGVAGCVFHEAFSVDLESARAKAASLSRELEAKVGAWPTSDLSYAPAPHTLYTTHLEIVKELIAKARASGARTTLHLAEHAGERRVLEGGDGPIADWYARFFGRGEDAAARARTPGEVTWPLAPLFDVAEKVGALAPGVLLVHLTEARPNELERVAKSGASVVFCPRSNLHIETKLPPLLAARAAGIDAALGTDSLASNASLDVLAEARALRHRFSSVPPKELLQMATWNGARALGREDLGRLARGARPGIVAVDGDVGTDACAFLLENIRAPRRFVAGRGERKASE